MNKSSDVNSNLKFLLISISNGGKLLKEISELQDKYKYSTKYIKIKYDM